MTDKTVTPQEVDQTQALTKLMLTFATGNEPHIGMGALIMATAVGARAMNLPLEDVVAMFDKTVTEVYTVAETHGFGNTLN